MRCTFAKETLIIGKFVPPLCNGRGTTKWWKGFASVRSTLAGVAETGSETAQRLERFASARSALADLAERRTDEVFFAKETLIIVLYKLYN